MTPPFVKKFDFRGVYGKDIVDKDAYYLGKAVVEVLQPQKVLIGWDTRVSSRNLALRFMSALSEHKVDISYMDRCSIDFVTSGAQALDFDFSVMFTGSHNPWDWTGLLMHTKGGNSVQGAMVEKLVAAYVAASTAPYTDKQVDLSVCHDVFNHLAEVLAGRIAKLIPLAQIPSLKVVVDVGDGSGTASLTVLERLLPQVQFVRLNDRKLYDANSSHTADPSNLANMQDLMGEMKKGGYDAGFAFDSDADRVLAVDEKGNYLNGSFYGSAIVDVFAKLGIADTAIGYAVDCGPALYNTVTATGKPFSIVPIPVGRSIIRGMVMEQTLDVGVENVGHFYIKDFFMTDSGAFSLVIILYWLTISAPLSTLSEKHQDGQRGQKFVEVSPVQEEAGKKLVEAITARFADREIKIITVDGIRYEIFNGAVLESWFAMRRSGYENIEKYFWGSIDATIFDELSALMQMYLPTA